MRLIARFVLTVTALALASLIAAGMGVAVFGDLGIPQSPQGALGWQLGSWGVIGATLVWIGMRARVAGWRRASSLALLFFGIAHFNSVIEARFFGLLGSRQLYALLAMSAATALLLGVALLAIFRGVSPRETPASWGPRLSLGRLAAGAAGYVLAYFAAGMVVFPFVREFYAQRPMPGGGEVIAMQLLIRGPVFVAMVVLLVRLSGGSRRETIVTAGGALALLGGVAMLMVPNPFIPDAARWAHFVEVTTSNLAYGCFVAWLLTAPTRVVAPAAELPAAT